jgi:hypothetical protein
MARPSTLVIGIAPLMLALVVVGCGQPGGETPPRSAPTPLPTSQPAPPSDSPEPEPGADPAPAIDACGAAKLSAYRDQPFAGETRARIEGAIGHNRIRVIRPSDAVTMDFRADRLNIEIGANGRIERLHCG